MLHIYDVKMKENAGHPKKNCASQTLTFSGKEESVSITCKLNTFYG